MNDEQRAKALAEFTTYFVENYPGPNTVIYDPKWHAPKIFRAAESALAARNVEEVLSRASWQDDGSRREAAYQKASQSVRVEVSKGAFEMGWHARDAEIADLKRQLAERMAGINAEMRIRLRLEEARWWVNQMSERGHRFDLWKEEADRLTELEKLLERAKKVESYPIALDAYVQEKVDRAVLAESEWWFERHFCGQLPQDCTAHQRHAANRAKAGEGK